MKVISILICVLLTGCAGWSPIQEVKAQDGSTWYWIAPLPSGNGYASASSYQVNTYQGTVNGRGYTVTTFARGR